MSRLIAVSHSPFRFLLALPMLAQMFLMLFMATHGRPAMKSLGPDWLLHFTAYFILSILAWIACHGTFPRPTLSMHRRNAVILTVAFAIIDEGLQSTVTVRACELSDLVADCIGVGIGYLCITLFLRLIKENGQ